jgi:hypothetical protein
MKLPVNFILIFLQKVKPIADNIEKRASNIREVRFPQEFPV